MNHFAKACRSKKQNVSRIQSDSEDEDFGRIIVAKVESGRSNELETHIQIQGVAKPGAQTTTKMVADSGVSKTLLNLNDWLTIKNQCELVKTSKGFRPYGTSHKLPIIGRAHVTIKAEAGASIKTWAYIVKDKKEQSLLGKIDGERLGIISLNPKGAPVEVVNRISHITKTEQLSSIADEDKFPNAKDSVVKQFPRLFSDKTGKFQGSPIRIHVKDDVTPVVQPARRIPLQYIDQTKIEIRKMLEEDIIEGPIDVEEPGTFISNLVITDRKDKSRIRVTLDGQKVNNAIHTTHEPIPTVEELRHNFQGSEYFSSLDMTNCYHQFEIEENARKLFAFRTPWGIYRYKRMVMGTSPASSEIQKRIRETIKGCKNAVHIKDDIVVYGSKDTHDKYLKVVLDTLQKKGITLRPDKCKIKQTEVKWFGHIFSKAGMSPDPEKCKIIKDWPQPKNCKEVKSFLQTVQFNAKFLGGRNSGDSYPVLTEPLRRLTKKNARFVWGTKEKESFIKLKQRLCSESVMSPYETTRKTRLYVDSSPIGTQATLAQLHTHNNEEVWKPVNHTSRAWTETESRYGQIERESNGILTGMMMNKMYTLGTDVEIVTDHKPLIPIYNATSRPKNLRIDRHRTKLLPFTYSIIHEPGVNSPCDYGSRHPPNKTLSTQEINEWQVENDEDIFVNRVIEDTLSHAVSMNELREESKNDPEISKLIASIGKSHFPNDLSVNKVYKEVYSDLWTTDGILMRNHQIVVPLSLQPRLIAIAHQGHQHSDKTLKLLRQTCWFPMMHKAVSDFVSSCISCNAASPHNTPVPLEPNLLPKGPWQNLHADFKGPIAGSYYLHVVIDQYSKYPEVDILKSTSFAKLQPVLDRIFNTHGIPDTLSTDNGPPYSSHDMTEYAKHMGFKLTPVTPYDPQSNGFAENFVKQLCKLIHTAVADGKDPKRELNGFLLQYRATPHSTTEMSPAEMLFGRKIKTRLPQHYHHKETPTEQATREVHDSKKRKQKQYFDKRYCAKRKDLSPGDKVLLKQKKTTVKPPFNPNPHTVVAVEGNRVTIHDGEKNKVRDKNKLKYVPSRPRYLEHNQSKSIHRPSAREEADVYFQPETPLQPEMPQVDCVNAEIQSIASSASSNPTENQVASSSFDMREHLEGLLNAAEERERNNANPDTVQQPQNESQAEEQHGNAGMKTHLLQLLDAALARGDAALANDDDVDGESTERGMSTRSQGKVLAWSKEMNPAEAVIEI